MTRKQRSSSQAPDAKTKKPHYCKFLGQNVDPNYHTHCKPSEASANAMSHTPTPWEMFETYRSFSIKDSLSRLVTTVCWEKDFDNRDGSPIREDVAKANAELIIRAVNSHEELLAILKDVIKFVGYEPRSIIYKRIQAAIAKAEGK